MTALVGALPLDVAVPRESARELAASRTVQAALLVGRRALVNTAALAVWLVLFGTVLSGLQEDRSQHTLFAQFRQQLAEATAPVSAPISLGAPVALISVPELGLRDAVVVQGTASRQLVAGPGHRPDTVLPGQAGVSVLYGRTLSYGAPFADLTSLAKGDQVSVVTGQGRFTYVVAGTRRAGDAITPPPSGAGRLTLVTAEGSGRLGRWDPRSTVYVDALLAKAAPAGVVAASRAADAPMKGDGGAIVSLVLWMELVVGLSLAVVWSARRWGGRQAWTVGAVALLAAVWGASESAWALLPNLL